MMPMQRSVQIWLLALLALVDAPACARTPRATPTPAPAPAHARGVISAERARIEPEQALAHVRYLASEELQGRGVTTDGILKAAEYIASQLWQDGLEPAGGAGTFFQRFPATLEQRVADAAVVAGATPLRLGEDFVVLGGSASSAVKAPLLYAGFGITDPDHDWDDFAHIDAHGRIVVVLDRLPNTRKVAARLGAIPEKIANARQHGAVGLILASRSEDRLVAGRWGGNAAGIVAVQLRAGAVERLLDRGLGDLEREGPGRTGPPVLLRAELARKAFPAVNVVALLRGSDPQRWREMIVVGAHYDHLGRGFPRAWTRSCGGVMPGVIFPGADDNASGVAGLLEVAEAFAGAPARPPRSVLFVAFAAEESGLLGSRFFVEHPPVPLDDVVAMINLDMIGRLRSAEGVEVQGTTTAPQFSSLLARANIEGIKLTEPKTIIGDSDHEPFHVKGRPVLFFSTGLHAEYHCYTDTANRINAQGLAQVGRLAYRLVGELAAAEFAPGDSGGTKN